MEDRQKERERERGRGREEINGKKVEVLASISSTCGHKAVIARGTLVSHHGPLLPMSVWLT